MIRLKGLNLFISILFLLGCAQSNKVSKIEFLDVTESAGLINPLKGMACHSAIFGDVNNDGFPDLFVGNFTHFNDSVYNVRGHINGKEPNKFFINQGDGTFKEIENSPVRIRGKNSGGAFADFDNDGDLDFVISHQSHLKVWPNDLPESAIERNRFFENDGMGNLIDITEKSGLDFGYPFLGRTTFVLDFDGDGLLDLLMQEDFVLGDISGGNSRLMKNMGNLIFEDVTGEAGLPTGFQKGLYGLGGFTDDINGDTWPDIFFAHSCRMFLNNRDGTFREKKYNMVSKQIASPSTVNMDWTCGANTGDLDNDGDLDFVMGDHYAIDGDYHHLFVFLNEGNDKDGNPIIRDVSSEAGIVDPDGRLIHMQLLDADNDGKIDIMTSKCNAFVYRNLGAVDGIPMFDKPLDSGIKGGLGYWAGGSFADYDRDGKIDFFGPEWESSVASPLLRNVTKGAENYIDIKLDLENESNRNGIGARVEIYKTGFLGDENQRLGCSIISVANGYSSGYEAIAHFGLPDDIKVDIKVSMPCDGPVYTTIGVKRNQMYILKL